MSDHLAGPIGLLKYYTTRLATEIGDDAVQIFGGRGITKTGMGKHIEVRAILSAIRASRANGVAVL
jgi:alkylation response protein AidB-like acyl-CoA dehydrogenase